MSITSYIGSNFQNSSNVTSVSSPQINTGLISIVDSVAPSGTLSVAIPYTFSTATAIYVTCDQLCSMTPNTGSSAVLDFDDPTMAFIWIAGNPAGTTNPWNQDFASLSVVNENASVAMNLSIYVVYTA